MEWHEDTVPVQSYIMDRELEQLELQLGEFARTGFCVLVGRQVDALVLTMQACGIGPGDRVLCSAFGLSSTVQAIQRLGALPVFVDINLDTFNLDPYCLNYVIGKCRRTQQYIPKALITSDLFGLPCDYEKITGICQKYGITLIEDMCGAFGATMGEGVAGSFGRFAVCHLFADRPQAGFGEDCAVFCGNEQDLRLLRGIRMTLRQDGTESGNIHSALTQAIFINERIKGYGKELEKRRVVAAMYRERLEGLVGFQKVGQGYESAYTQFAILLPDEAAQAAVIAAILENELHCTYYPTPLHMTVQENKYPRVILKNAETTATRLLAIPMHPHLTARSLDHICGCIRDALQVEQKAKQEREPTTNPT